MADMRRLCEFAVAALALGACSQPGTTTSGGEGASSISKPPLTLVYAVTPVVGDPARYHVQIQALASAVMPMAICDVRPGAGVALVGEAPAPLGDLAAGTTTTIAFDVRLAGSSGIVATVLHPAGSHRGVGMTLTIPKPASSASGDASARDSGAGIPNGAPTPPPETTPDGRRVVLQPGTPR